MAATMAVQAMQTVQAMPAAADAMHLIWLFIGTYGVYGG